MAQNGTQGRTATIGDRDRSGNYEITDTRWDSNGTMFVTVRALFDWIGPRDIATMRRLARRVLHYPELTRSSRAVRTWRHGGCVHVTFAVSRLMLTS